MKQYIDKSGAHILHDTIDLDERYNYPIGARVKVECSYPSKDGVTRSYEVFYGVIRANNKYHITIETPKSGCRSVMKSDIFIGNAKIKEVN